MSGAGDRREMGLKGLVVWAALLAPLPAAAQAWQTYSFHDQGFAVQLPAAPSVTSGLFKSAAGASVPAKTYALRQDDILFTMTVADFSRTDMQRQTALDDAVKAYGQTSQIKVDVVERIDQQYGRQLSLAGKDGSQSAVSIFFVNNRLYELEGRALPPDPASGSGKGVRFQQSLEFIDLGAEARRPENRAAAGGGPGARRPPPPPQAFADCRGKAVGAPVQHLTPEGLVPATCVQSPQGLTARPDRPPAGEG